MIKSTDTKPEDNASPLYSRAPLNYGDPDHDPHCQAVLDAMQSLCRDVPLPSGRSSEPPTGSARQRCLCKAQNEGNRISHVTSSFTEEGERSRTPLMFGG